MYYIPYYGNMPMYNYGDQLVYWTPPYQTGYANRAEPSHFSNGGRIELKDYGDQPLVIKLDNATKQNDTYRTALWTGKNLQVTLMSINVGDNIGLEVHPNVDQFLYIEQGEGYAQMGPSKNNLNYERRVYENYAVVVPAGTWHNVTNTGNVPLKLYSIYAPPNHPFGTVHVTKADAEASEAGYGQGNQ
ncbi:cupin [Lysinibacillus xylanilyticus]|uniref:Cupin n=1 Tax=Lysinibacillus xylanilyticus TaxID=582475 RepID=A0A0K9FGW7_9BACI|nr:cupin domain-containing protein [Lysinibacillus xylanilyticus]KMY33779.1 cupin [Lysinibacillus xylanilyticus]